MVLHLKIWQLLLLSLLLIGATTQWTEAAPQEQLSDQDLLKILSLIGGGGQPAEQAPLSPLLPKPIVTGLDLNVQPEKPRALPPSQDDIAQSLSLLSTVFSSNPEVAALMSQQFQNMAAAKAAAAPTTTTPNPLAHMDPKDAALLQALVSSASSDTSQVASLLGLAANGGPALPPAPTAPPTTPTPKGTSQDALLAQLLTSMSQGQGIAPSSPVKQQDFQNFQNAGASLDTASTAQLNGILGLLGTLGSLSGGGGGGGASGLFGQPSAQNNILGGLLGGGGQQQSAEQNLLASLLSQTAQQQQRPSLFSSIGNLASVVGSSLLGNRLNKNTKPTVRGVDTRLGLGYKFSDNADAQVVFEIGPQLFTEPLTDEQKRQQKVQEQQQQQQQQQQLFNGNRRISIVPSMASPTVVLPAMAPSVLPIMTSTVVNRRLPPPPAPVSRMSAPRPMVPVQRRQVQPTFLPPLMQSSTMRQQQQLQRIRPTVMTLQKKQENVKRKNYYDKKEANPLTNSHSQLTDYERTLMLQQLSGTAQSPLADFENRRDGFVFGKNNGDQAVHVKSSQRLPQQPVPTVGRMGYFQHPMNPGGLQHRSQPINFAAEDSYAKRNVIGMSPFTSEYERQREMEQVSLKRTRRPTHHGMNPAEMERRSIMAALNAYNAYNANGGSESSMLEVVQNYVIPGLRAQGNEFAKTFFRPAGDHGVAPLPTSAVPPTVSSTSAPAPPPSSTPTQPQQQQQQQQQQQAEGQQQTTTLSSVPAPAVGKTPRQRPQQQQGQNGGRHRGLLPNFSDLPSISELIAEGSNTMRNMVRSRQKAKPKPFVRVGDHVSYDELSMLLNGGQPVKERESEIPVLRDASEIMAEAAGGFSTPAPEIFIDISNGEVSMRKAFGTMDTFDPTPAPELPPDHPKHVFSILKEQLAKEYQRVKEENLKKAAEQKRKENIANGLINPQDPIYMIAKDFELIEKESL